MSPLWRPEHLLSPRHPVSTPPSSPPHRAESSSRRPLRRLRHAFSPAHPVLNDAVIAPASVSCHPGSSSLVDGHSGGSLTEKQGHRSGNLTKSTRKGQSRVTVDMLPDVTLLKIFDFYVPRASYAPWVKVEGWKTLVHVCRKWRNVVFGSPRRLNLRLYCQARTPAREMLDVWPPLPIAVSCSGHKEWGVDNIIAALEQNDRICDLDFIDAPSSQILAAMQRPVPELTRLLLWFEDETAPVVPASFLGGSAPRLQTLSLSRIPFPGLPKLLLSATHLSHLCLSKIPHSGYISPEAMVTGLSALTRLYILTITFKDPRSRPDGASRRPPPLIRTLLPALAFLTFEGVSEYLEDLIARIDAPLFRFEITFFHQLTFNTLQLSQFISRTPKLKAHIEVHVFFCNSYISVSAADERLSLKISCKQLDQQLSSLEQVCSSFFAQDFVPAVEHLYFHENGFWRLQGDIETSQWLDVLHPFTAVKSLYISSGFMPSIAPALQDLVGERVTVLLPALQTLFLEALSRSSRSAQEAIGEFVAARQLASHPISVSPWVSRYKSRNTPMCSRQPNLPQLKDVFPTGGRWQ